MSRIVLLDACTLGKVSNPNDTEENRRCREWSLDLRRKGTSVRVPEIADYEIRRELIRAYKSEGLRLLDETKQFGFVSLSEASLILAAELWADAHRLIGRTASDDPKLDPDMIICGQAKVLAMAEGAGVVVATENLVHFVPFVDGTYLVDAKPWYEIDP